MTRFMTGPSLRAGLAAFCAVAFLSACGNDKSGNEIATASLGLLKNAGSKLGSAAKSKSDAKPAAAAAAADPNALVAKALAATKGPVAIAVRLDTKAVLAMSPVGRNGGYVTWGSAAGQSITFKNGVMTNTRGLGEDLMSSRVDNAVAAITARRAANYARDHYYLGGLGQSTRLSVNCNLAATKSERVALGAINANATIMKESCSGNGISFQNLYWVDGSGRVLKSSQWVGQRIGSLAIQNLRL